MTKFPKVLYVKMETDSGTTYPVPSEDLIDIVEVGERILIGVYDLRETAYAECEVKMSKKSSK